MRLDKTSAGVVRRDLERVWHAMTGSPPTTFEADVSQLAQWYGPAVRDATIRNRLADVEHVPVSQCTRGIVPPLVISCGGATLVTPEGRLGLEQLRDARDDPDGACLLLESSGELVEIYRSWVMARLNAAVRQHAGEGPLVRPPAVGVVVLLLIHGAIGRPASLRVDQRMGDNADQAIRSMLSGFAEAISQRSGKLKAPIWGWPISRARAGFPGLICRERETGGDGTVEHYFVAPDGLDELLSRLAHELVGRRALPPELVVRAIDELAAACETNAGLLGTAGISLRRARERSAIGRFRALLAP